LSAPIPIADPRTNTWRTSKLLACPFCGYPQTWTLPAERVHGYEGGWGYCRCRICEGLVFLMAIPPDEPIPIPLDRSMPQLVAVRYRLPDHPQTRVARWRPALVTSQEGDYLNLTIMLDTVHDADVSDGAAIAERQVKKGRNVGEWWDGDPHA
jgi:hypothetical protein